MLTEIKATKSESPLWQPSLTEIADLLAGTGSQKDSVFEKGLEQGRKHGFEEGGTHGGKEGEKLANQYIAGKLLPIMNNQRIAEVVDLSLNEIQSVRKYIWNFRIGYEEGQTRACRHAARQLLPIMGDEQIAEITELSLEEVQQIRDADSGDDGQRS